MRIEMNGRLEIQALVLCEANKRYNRLSGEIGALKQKRNDCLAQHADKKREFDKLLASEGVTATKLITLVVEMKNLSSMLERIYGEQSVLRERRKKEEDEIQIIRTEIIGVFDLIEDEIKECD